MSQYRLLELLADGAYRSGEEIGAELGISRAAVWKQFKKLEQLGLKLDAQKGRGYCILGGLDLLDRDGIVSRLPEALLRLGAELDVLGTTDSTNAVASKRAASGAAHGYICMAEQQTNGRGRRGRQWQSPFGQNIYLSMVWEFQSGAAALEGLSLSVGLAVVRALARVGVKDTKLKWPNDVLHEGRKLAGILLEMQGDPAGLCQVVIGIGVNLDLNYADVSAITQPFVDVRTILGEPVDRNQFTATLITELVAVLQQFSSEGFAGLRREWLGLDAYADKEVAVQLGEQWIVGIAQGVDGSGGLVLNVDGRERVFHGGEISLRAKA